MVEKIGQGDVISFKIRDLGLIAKELRAPILFRFKERTDVKESIKARDAAKSAMRKAEKFAKQSKLTEFRELQRHILDLLREAIQKQYDATFINDVLRKRMLDRLGEFLKNHPQNDRAKKIFENLMTQLRIELIEEREKIHGLIKLTEGAGTVAYVIKKRFLLKEGIFGKMYRTWTDRAIVSREFKIEARVEKIEKKKTIDDKEFFKLVGLLRDFNKQAKKLSEDLVILMMTMIDSQLHYEKVIEECASEDPKKGFKIPKSYKKYLAFYEGLRKKAIKLFENEVEMLNQLGGLERGAKAELKTA